MKFKFWKSKKEKVIEKAIKKINLKEFVEGGYLQEANRLFFHPLGLALAVMLDKGKYSLDCVWDAREDPEGYYYDLENSDDERKCKFFINAEKIEKERLAKQLTRIGKFGGVIEPINYEAKTNEIRKAN